MTDRLAEAARAMTLRYENLSHNASCYLSRHAGGYECTCGLDKVKNDLREALAAFDALEEKAAALDWLLALSRKSYGVDIDNVSSVCILRIRDIDDVVTTIGTGPTPLAAVLDAKSKEKANG